MGGAVDAVGDFVGGVVDVVTDPLGSRAAKDAAERARKQQKKLEKEQQKLMEEERKRRESMLRAATVPTQSLFDTLGSPQDNRSTLG